MRTFTMSKNFVTCSKKNMQTICPRSSLGIAIKLPVPLERELPRPLAWKRATERAFHLFASAIPSRFPTGNFIAKP
jgi:hypothetical protein